MPGKVKVKIVAGRNLPVMDRSSDTTDAYVEIKLGNTTYKTDVCRKSLNPRWNSEWYRFEVDDAELQDEPLQIRLMDYDMYSANDAIGKVYIDLNPLLLPVCQRNQVPMQSSPCPGGGTETVTFSTSGGTGGTLPGVKPAGSGSIMAGWLPVYDTMHGIRGEVNVSIKVELFSDFNKFRQSSCGVQFFCSPNIPYGYHAQVIHGFVEELVVNDDPEYHWIDKIRTPRASNEARQTLFFKLSGEVQRKIGLKALDLGANSVIGYHQCFDLEGESGIVARGIGTAVSLIRLQDMVGLDSSIPDMSLKEEGGVNNVAILIVDATLLSIHACNNSMGSIIGIVTEEILIPMTGPVKEGIPTHGHCRTESVGSKATKINAIQCIHRRSSDSDLSITPKDSGRKRNSLSNAERPTLIGSGGAAPQFNSHVRPTIKQGNWEILEFPFITMAKFPAGFIIHLGGTVTARSVKLLERISNLEEPESRDTWWTELRMEMRSHARALACNVILGYTEHASICDDVCVLSATGTAAVINLQCTARGADVNDLPVFLGRPSHNPPHEALEKLHIQSKISPIGSIESVREEKPPSTYDSDATLLPCAMCHIPYCEASVPFPIIMLKCGVCKHGKVPDVLITTIEIPDDCLIMGRACLIQAHVCRQKRDLRAELNAKEISDGLPFLEYDLHRLLINKLKVKGMNTIFGLKVQVSIGERMLVGTASGTGVFLLPLPSPSLPKLIAGIPTTNKEKLAEMQKLLSETVKKNKELYQLRNLSEAEENLAISQQIKLEDETEEVSKLDLTTGNKDSCILEIDDAEDTELFAMLMEAHPPLGFHVVNTEQAPGLDEFEVVRNLQMFTQMSRVKLSSTQYYLRFGKHFQRLLQTVYFKLRRMSPCILCKLQFRIDIPEADEVQLTAFGTAIGIGKANRSLKPKRKLIHSASKEAAKKSMDDSDDIFTLEEDDEQDILPTSILPPPQHLLSRSKSPIHGRNHISLTDVQIPHPRHGIDITSLSYIPGGKIMQYLGNLNFFFIRESTSIREGNGLSGFVHSFVTEVLAIMRAHIAALGGNAMVAYFMTECVLFHNPHKNQGQCLINVGGDVVFVSYFSDSLKVAQSSVPA